MFCRYCGNEIPDDSRFCAKCGKIVDEVQAKPKKSKSSEKITAAVGKMSKRTRLLLAVSALALAVVAVICALLFLNNEPSDAPLAPGIDYDYDIPNLPNGDIDYEQLVKDLAEKNNSAGSSANKNGSSSSSSSSSSGSSKNNASSGSSSSSSSSSSSNKNSSSSGSSSSSSDFYNRTCSTCGGDGDCNACSGKGYKEIYTPGEPRERERCWRCGGSGNCDGCGGDGKK